MVLIVYISEVTLSFVLLYFIFYQKNWKISLLLNVEIRNVIVVFVTASEKDLPKQKRKQKLVKSYSIQDLIVKCIVLNKVVRRYSVKKRQSYNFLEKWI